MGFMMFCGIKIAAGYRMLPGRGPAQQRRDWNEYEITTLSENKIRWNSLRAHIEGAALYKAMEPVKVSLPGSASGLRIQRHMGWCLLQLFLSRFAVASPHLMPCKCIQPFLQNFCVLTASYGQCSGKVWKARQYMKSDSKTVNMLSNHIQSCLQSSSPQTRFWTPKVRKESTDDDSQFPMTWNSFCSRIYNTSEAPMRFRSPCSVNKYLCYGSRFNSLTGKHWDLKWMTKANWFT